jgi:pescadillo protein
MVKRLKEGQKGACTNYITRAEALKKLQLSLADFRRMCILKGVYPRQPARMLKGADKTYYHIKDINYLARDPIRDSIYEKEAADKKARKLVARKDKARARRLEKVSGEMDLTHIVKERYPSFEAALEDLDDCVSMLALFAILPADNGRFIDPQTVHECAKLYDDFLLYVTSANRLRKVFASIKGFYFQADMPGGVSVTWLQPHRFSPTLPVEVDFKVLVTFAQWYRTLQKFVNFKLYSMEGWSYPPTVTSKTTVGTNFATMKFTSQLSVTASDSMVDSSQVFKTYKFFVSRECQFLPLALVIRSGGGKVFWSDDEHKSTMEAEGITHVVIDRPGDIQRLPNREYIQPQWVFDSFNEGILLPVTEYALGVELPPHLSPFAPAEGEDEYIPKRRQVLNALIAKRQTQLAQAVAAELGEDISDELEAIKATQREKERLESIRLEKLGVEAVARRTERENERVVEDKIRQAQQDQREHAKSLMSKKHRRLLQRIETTKSNKNQLVAKLQKRAAEIKPVAASKKVSRK